METAYYWHGRRERMRSQDNRSNVYSEAYQKANVEGQDASVATMPEVCGSVPVARATTAIGTRIKRAAFIGTRRVEGVSQLAHSTYLDLVEMAVRQEYTIRTGAAPGADQIAAARALHLGGTVELVLPWMNYEHAWRREILAEFRDQITTEVYDYEKNIDWRESVKAYHPSWGMLTHGAYSLHARNYGIIEPCEVVVALTAPDRKGGTEQGIRIAEALEKRRIILESPDRSRSGRMVLVEGDGDPDWSDSWIPVQPDSPMEEL